MKALVVVQARFGSTRLPGKALYPLNGIPMIAFLLRRLKASLPGTELVLATTDRPEDGALEAWALSEGVHAVRGDVDDVLSRFVLCLRRFPADVVVRVTGDNPLTSHEMISLAVKRMGRGDCNYLKAYEGCPLGAGVDAFSPRMIEALHAMDLSPQEREHINMRLINDGQAAESLAIPESWRRPDIHLTVDTREDYDRMRSLVEQGHGSCPDWSITHVIESADGLAL